ncbi:hypothetical protein ABPG77_010343 [Micractinium sp. CCAP 211/92]
MELSPRAVFELLQQAQHGTSTAAQVDALESLAVAASTSEARRAIQAAGGLPVLVALLGSDSSDVQLAASFALFTMCLYEDEDTALVVAAGAVPALLQLLRPTGAGGAAPSSAEPCQKV